MKPFDPLLCSVIATGILLTALIERTQALSEWSMGMAVVVYLHFLLEFFYS